MFVATITLRAPPSALSKIFAWSSEGSSEYTGRMMIGGSSFSSSSSNRSWITVHVARMSSCPVMKMSTSPAGWDKWIWMHCFTAAST